MTFRRKCLHLGMGRLPWDIFCRRTFFWRTIGLFLRLQMKLLHSLSTFKCFLINIRTSKVSRRILLMVSSNIVKTWRTFKATQWKVTLVLKLFAQCHFLKRFENLAKYPLLSNLVALWKSFQLLSDLMGQADPCLINQYLALWEWKLLLAFCLCSFSLLCEIFPSFSQVCF